MGTVIQSLATANPPRYVTGPEVFEFLAGHFEMAAPERDLYRRLLIDGPIRGRYMGLDQDEDICLMSADQQLARFHKHALAIATRAARDALSSARLRPADIGGLVINTCTGYLCPGLSSYVAEALELEPSIRVLDLMGMGCGAAIPNLQSAWGLLATGPTNGSSKPVLSIAVEVCSATIFMGQDPGLIVSNCLFGDGAAAAVLALNGHDETSHSAGAHRAVKLLDFESQVLPAHRESLRYHHHEGRLKNTLSIRVPIIAGQAVREVTARLLARHGLSSPQIDWWIVHPGGTAVLEQLARELDLPGESLRYSYDVLRDYGNMSSPSVLFVLKRLLDEGKPQPGQRGLILSFGAGFTAFAALVEF